MNDPTTGPRSHHDHDCRGPHTVDMSCRTAAQLRQTYISIRDLGNSHSSSSLPRLSTLNREPEIQAQASNSTPALFGISNVHRDRAVVPELDAATMADSGEGIPMQNITSSRAGAVSNGHEGVRQRHKGCGLSSWLCFACFGGSSSGNPLQPNPNANLPNAQQNPPQDIGGDEDEGPFPVPDLPPLPNPALDPAQNPSHDIARQLMVKSGEIEEISGPVRDPVERNGNHGGLPGILEEAPGDDGESAAGDNHGVTVSANPENQGNEGTLRFSRRPLPIPHPIAVSGISAGLQRLSPCQGGPHSQPEGIPQLQAVAVSRPILYQQSPTYSQPCSLPRLGARLKRRASV